MQVSVNPFAFPAVDVIVRRPGEDERVYTIEPILKDEAGFALDAPVIGEEYKAMSGSTSRIATARCRR